MSALRPDLIVDADDKDADADAEDEKAIAAHLAAKGVCRLCVLRFLGRDDPDAYQRELSNGAIEPINSTESINSTEPTNSINSTEACPTCLGILPRVSTAAFRDGVVRTIAASGFGPAAFLLTVSTPACLIPRDALLLHELFGCRTCDGAITTTTTTKKNATYDDNDLRERLNRVVPVKRALKLVLGPRVAKTLGVPVAADAELRYALAIRAEALPPVEIPRQLLDKRRVREHDNLRRRGTNIDEIVSGALLTLVRDHVGDHGLLAAVARTRTPIAFPKGFDPRLVFRAVLDRDPLFIAGRYLKMQRYLPQTGGGNDEDEDEGERYNERYDGERDNGERYDEDGVKCAGDGEKGGCGGVGGCGVISGSVAAAICPPFVLYGHADGATFHAAGREDVDVRMRGGGRPFLVELRNSRGGNLVDWTAFAKTFSDVGVVLAGTLKLVKPAAPTNALRMLSEGSTTKRKTYRALCWASRSLPGSLATILANLGEIRIAQHTPLRVLHRRTLLRRYRSIDDVRLEKRLGSRYFVVSLTAQAGTYVKEFCNGDCGRTRPALGELITEALRNEKEDKDEGKDEDDPVDIEILQLDVTDVDMVWPPS